MIKIKKKIILYLVILSIFSLAFSFIGDRLIMKYKFPLKTNNLEGLEELTSKVFAFTNHNDYQKMDHSRLIHGLGLLPYTSLDNKLTENTFFIYNTIMNYFKLDGYLCGGHSRYLQRLFEKHGIKSFTYSHGLEYTHVIVVAEYNNNLYIFDPTFNYVYHNGKKQLTFEEVISLVRQKKDLEKFIKIINSQFKVFNMKHRKYDNYMPSKIVNVMNKDKDHILLNGSEIYAGTGSMDYFFEKYPYLKSLIK